MNSKMTELKLTKLGLEGLKTLVGWAAAEGWNPGYYDAEVFYKTDPDGFYGYFLDGELIAGGSIVAYGKEFGFMGFFIVRPEYRAQGIGRRLWHQRRDKLIARLKKEAPIGMDGVVDMQPFYQKGGFEIAFRDERHELTGRNEEVDHRISPIENQDFDSVDKYDRLCFGFSRSRFLKNWLQMPRINTFKFSEKRHLQGYAVMRKALIGYKICPLFAENSEVAEALLKACLNQVPGEYVYLDIPMVNKAAVELTQKYNSIYVFECARMYYGKAPEMDTDKIFGITTFELG
jgi:GNAT superfamily N-acetyltransferase